MSEVERLFAEYLKKFGGLPMPLLDSCSDERLEEILRECLKTGKAFEFDAETEKLMAEPDNDF